MESESYCTSQETDASIVRVGRLQKLNEFLEVCGIIPVKCLKESLERSIESTKRRYFSKANECITAVLKTVCPEDISLIRKSHFEKPSIPEKDTSSSFLEAIVSSYMKANTFTLRRQLLSIATNDYSFAEVSAQIHGLTRYSANLYSDNATIALFHQELGKRLKSYDFCESQDGKGPCDI